MTPNNRPPAVILLSGGLDSATVLAMANAQGFACHCLSFDYGQRHTHELKMAAKQAHLQGAASHRVAKVDIGAFGGSALTADITVPKDRSDDAMTHGIPITYVPARNTVFLSYALGLAEVLGAKDLFVGVNAVDYSGYPDCRPQFIEAFEKLANLATKAGVESLEAGNGPHFRIHAPLIDFSKRAIIEQGTLLGVDYGQTSTCYDPKPDGKPCLHCDACQLRLRAFAELGRVDPVVG